jgi:hypothetical protein
MLIIIKPHKVNNLKSHPNRFVTAAIFELLQNGIYVLAEYSGVFA